MRRKPLTPEMAGLIFARNGALREPSDPHIRIDQLLAADVDGEGLLARTFPIMEYIVPGIVAAEAVLLAGKPKSCKSWLALDISLAVARGTYCLGDRKCDPGEVLYLSLDQGLRLVQSRIKKILSSQDAASISRFHVFDHWFRADEGGVEAIDAWCSRHPQARLIVVDVLAYFRAPSNGRSSMYEYDYQSVSPLREIAAKRNVAVLIVHHTRKGTADDPVDEVSGTLGLLGAVDGFLVLRKSGSSTVMVGSSRNIPGDIELAMEFNPHSARWTILGAAGEVQQREQHGRVLGALETAGASGLKPSELAEAIGIARNHAKQVLWRLSKTGNVRVDTAGRYFPVTAVTGGDI